MLLQRPRQDEMALYEFLIINAGGSGADRCMHENMRTWNYGFLHSQCQKKFPVRLDVEE